MAKFNFPRRLEQSGSGSSSLMNIQFALIKARPVLLL
jgi:hypothetical protein